MTVTACRKCAHPLTRSDHLVGFSVEVMGDEYTYSYFACPECGQLTIERYHDRFMGEAEVSFMGPLPPSIGQEVVALLRDCPAPHDKRCRCKAHEALYYGTPATLT